MTTAIKLYELSDAREILDDWLAESEGELTPEIETLLAELDGKTDEKIERVALFIREQVAEAAAVQVEEDRLRGRRKAREKAAESLKGYLLRQMDLLGKTKVQGLLATVAVQKNPPSVTTALNDGDLMDAFSDPSNPVGEFVREVPASYRLDRDAVMAAYKNGGQLPEAIVVTTGSHIRIR